MMNIADLILIALGILVLIGFLRQFGVLSGKGLTYALIGAGLVFGFSVFQKLRRNRLDRDFKKREEELEKQRKALTELQKELEISDREVQEADAAIEKEKAAFKKKMAEIEAEKEKDMKKRKQQINNMSIKDLMREF